MIKIRLILELVSVLNFIETTVTVGGQKEPKYFRCPRDAGSHMPICYRRAGEMSLKRTCANTTFSPLMMIKGLKMDKSLLVCLF